MEASIQNQFLFQLEDAENTRQSCSVDGIWPLKQIRWIVCSQQHHQTGTASLQERLRAFTAVNEWVALEVHTYSSCTLHCGNKYKLTKAVRNVQPHHSTNASLPPGIAPLKYLLHTLKSETSRLIFSFPTHFFFFFSEHLMVLFDQFLKGKYFCRRKQRFIAWQLHAN